MKDYYQILEVPYSADAQQIRKAFRKWAMIYHPDKNPSREASNIFQAYQQAYETLIHPGKKAEYDLELIISKPGTNAKRNIKNDHQLLSITEQILRQIRQIEPGNIRQEHLYLYMLWLQQRTTAFPLLKESGESLLHAFFGNLLHISSYLLHRFQVPVYRSMLELRKDLNFQNGDEEIRRKQKEAVQHEKIRKTLPYIIITAAALLCLVIFIAGK